MGIGDPRLPGGARAQGGHGGSPPGARPSVRDGGTRGGGDGQPPQGGCPGSGRSRLPFDRQAPGQAGSLAPGGAGTPFLSSPLAILDRRPRSPGLRAGPFGKSDGGGGSLPGLGATSAGRAEVSGCRSSP